MASWPTPPSPWPVIQSPGLGAQPPPWPPPWSLSPTHLLLPVSAPPQQGQEFKLLSTEDSGENCFQEKRPGPRVGGAGSPTLQPGTPTDLTTWPHLQGAPVPQQFPCKVRPGRCHPAGGGGQGQGATPGTLPWRRAEMGLGLCWAGRGWARESLLARAASPLPSPHPAPTSSPKDRMQGGVTSYLLGSSGPQLPL